MRRTQLNGSPTPLVFPRIKSGVSRATLPLQGMVGTRGSVCENRNVCEMGATMIAMPITTLPSGETVPVLGQGTWTMGADARNRKAEIAALRFGLDLGMTLIDTAEMYADGGAEKVAGQAIAGRRDEVFIVSK